MAESLRVRVSDDYGPKCARALARCVRWGQMRAWNRCVRGLGAGDRCVRGIDVYAGDRSVSGIKVAPFIWRQCSASKTHNRWFPKDDDLGEPPIMKLLVFS